MSKSTFVSLRLPNLFDVQLRVHAKYDVSWADAELAVEYLRCFFDAKARQPDAFIILPQIADWAWHELILDTPRYRQLCSRTFGRFLSHLKEEDDVNRNLRRVFAASMEMMRRTYGLGLGACEEDWLDAGWDRPLYRLRAEVARDAVPTDSPAPLAVDLDAVTSDLLSWLPDRLAQRFGVSRQQACHGVMAHGAHLRALARGDDAQRHACGSALGRIAWQEHILWTDRYAKDCDRLFGHFLDHDPLLARPARAGASFSLTA